MYEGNCKVRQVALPSSPGWRTDRWGWQTDTQGPATHAGWQDSTPKVLKWSVASVGGRIDVTRWAAWGASAQQPLIQGEVSPGSTGWLTLARGYYVPWHVDSLWLELAVERGWLGLLVWVAWTSCLFGVAVRRLGWPLAPGLVAWMGALGAVCLNGVLVSAFEFGRIAWLVQLLWVCASLWIMESANLPLKIPVTEREPCHRT